MQIEVKSDKSITVIINEKEFKMSQADAKKLRDTLTQHLGDMPVQTIIREIEAPLSRRNRDWPKELMWPVDPNKIWCGLGSSQATFSSSGGELKA